MKNRIIKNKRTTKRIFKYQKVSRKGIKSRNNNTRKSKNLKGGSQNDNEKQLFHYGVTDVNPRWNRSFIIKVKKYIPINCILKEHIIHHNSQSEEFRKKISPIDIVPNKKLDIKPILLFFNNYYDNSIKKITDFNRNYKNVLHKNQRIFQNKLLNELKTYIYDKEFDQKICFLKLFDLLNNLVPLSFRGDVYKFPNEIIKLNEFIENDPEIIFEQSSENMTKLTTLANTYFNDRINQNTIYDNIILTINSLIKTDYSSTYGTKDTSQEPVSQEPVSQEPVSQEPVSQEPVSQDSGIYDDHGNIKLYLFDEILNLDNIIMINYNDNLTNKINIQTNIFEFNNDWLQKYMYSLFKKFIEMYKLSRKLTSLDIIDTNTSPSKDSKLKLYDNSDKEIGEIVSEATYKQVIHGKSKWYCDIIDSNGNRKNVSINDMKINIEILNPNNLIHPKIFRKKNENEILKFDEKYRELIEHLENECKDIFQDIHSVGKIEGERINVVPAVKTIETDKCEISTPKLPTIVRTKISQFINSITPKRYSGPSNGGTG